MDMNERLNCFNEELNLIQNEDLREKVCQFLTEKVPDYFFTVPASSSGKYHPDFAKGEGGLVRHTQMAVAVLMELFRVEFCSQDTMDCMIAACILHDTFKHSYADCGSTLITHPTIASDEWMKFVGEENSDVERYRLVYYCILKHMGQWGPESAKCVDAGSYESCCSLVHLADFIASRKFFDMFKE